MSEVDILKSYVPDFIAQSKIFQAVYETQGIELDSINANIVDIVNQCFVNTATWGLTNWETFLGIDTDLTKDYAYRRTAIIAKMRGVGTVTAALIENVAKSFSNGIVTITENPSEYSFTVTFSGTLGMPPNMDDLTVAIEDIKPAHLAYTYVYVYNMNSALSAYTYAHLASFTQDQLREGTLS
jgi:hypothetical protein